MSILTSLRSQVAPKLGPFGFKYAGKPHGLAWDFQRRQGDVTQTISFAQVPFVKNALRIEFRSSLDDDAVDGADFVDHSPPMGLWPYSDDASLEGVLGELVSIAVTHGIPCLETVLSRRLLRPVPTTERTLLTESPRLSSDFAKRIGITLADPEALGEVEAFLWSLNKDGADEEWLAALQAAAWWGELLLSQFGVRWEWRYEGSTLPFWGDNGRILAIDRPLWRIANWWCRRHPRFSLVKGYTDYLHRFGVPRS